MEKKPLPQHMQPLLREYGVAAAAQGKACLLCYAPGEWLCREEEEMPYLLCLASGRAKVCNTTSGGKTLLLGFVGGRSILGEMELMTGRPACSSVKALSEVVCIGLPMEPCAEVLRGDVAFLNYVGASLANKLHRNSTNSMLNLLLPLEQRLCSYLLLVQQQGVVRENLTEVAELLGVSYRHVMRTLRALCAAGALQRAGGAYRVLDAETLKQKASDSLADWQYI